ncbi:SDR family NAD(P)-dependent oxidoreductase [Alkalihalobacillus sp. MEB130]|uniref:SDR family NAD(P)-dependent oxidoreductase n=1 Tax=Alkalihalobacillus sp. MEB130 TaxID=2976704 RepID=UPI0028DE17F8|nr:SDR family NAD(P)-dependent oxidoreductase [Alkalihalobacillus sp. MEB130]MDT8860242.1 SDR family NAD(P)-dependent oxidoreductase [Alkalihalobacillus sp. MEB130]
MNIFLTGATGFLGKKLIEKLLRQGHFLYVLVRNEKKLKGLLKEFTAIESQQIIAVYGDITNPSLVKDQTMMEVLQNKIDVVYHMAALLSFDEAMKKETFSVNVDGTRYVLEFAKRMGVQKFIYVSTAYTVGKGVMGQEQLYSTEQEFVNYYEQSKAVSEEVVFAYKGDFDVIVMRPAIIIGDTRTGEADTNFALYGLLKGIRVVQKMISKNDFYKNQSFRIMLEGETNSNLVPVDYVADVLAIALEHGQKETIYNVTNPNPLSNQTVFNIIKKTLSFPNLEIGSIECESELTKEEFILHERLKVFKEYLSRSIQFDSQNTSELLLAANLDELDLNEGVFEHMMTSYLQPKLVTQLA